MALTPEGVVAALEAAGMNEATLVAWASSLGMAQGLTTLDGYAASVAIVRSGVDMACDAAALAINDAKASIGAARNAVSSGAMTPKDAQVAALAAQQLVGEALAALGVALADAGKRLGGG